MVTEQLTELGWMEVVEPVLKRQSISAMQGPQNVGDKTELGALCLVHSVLGPTLIR